LGTRVFWFWRIATMRKKIVKRSLDTSSEQYQTVEAQFYSLAREFGGKTPPEHLPVWEKIENFLSSLVINNGWTRKNIYELFGNVLDKEIQKESAGDSQDALPSEAVDALMDYESAMVGNVQQDCIPRFPGDPIDKQEFIDYVYSGKWLE
jgi:hypothetical protein